MQNLYPFALIVHIFCAIIFVGYLFFDVVIFSRAKKSMSEDEAQQIGQKIGKKAIKIMPLCVLLLLLSGGMMLSTYINSDAGYFESNLQKLLLLKVALACVIFALVINALLHKLFKRKNPLNNYTHPIALTCAILLIIIAKIMFYV